MSYGKNFLLITASAFALSVAAPAFAQSGGSQNSPSASPSSPQTGAPADGIKPVPGTGPGGDTLKQSDRMAPATDGYASIGADWIAAQNIPARKLIGAEVVNKENDSIGEVEEVANLNGRETLVVSVGTFLGIGGYNIALDLGNATVFHHVNDMEDIRVLANMAEEQLKALPKYNPAGN